MNMLRLHAIICFQLSVCLSSLPFRNILHPLGSWYSQKTSTTQSEILFVLSRLYMSEEALASWRYDVLSGVQHARERAQGQVNVGWSWSFDGPIFAMRTSGASGPISPRI
ncbi:hypothetical protein IG631_08820 [Alternaria alternata]|nr:hypothetical protein IG631_08820 [Alternaria alternata]